MMGIFLPGAIKQLIEDGLDEELIVDSFDDPLYNEWLTNEDSDDPPEYYRIYAWNLTNVDAVVNSQAVPVIEEIGPYMYRLYKRKVTLDGEMGVLWGDDGSWSSENNDGSSARYTPYNFVHFDREESTRRGLSTDRDPTTDLICTVNKIYAGTVAVAGGIAEGAAYNAGDRYFYCEPGKPGVPVETLMFGRPEPYIYNYTSPQDAIDINMEWAFDTGKFSRKLVRRQLMWKNTKQVDDLWFQPDPDAPRPNSSQPWLEYVRGTDASQFPRKLEFGQRLDVWEKDIIRTVYLRNYDDEESTYKDIELMNFRVEPETYYPCQTYPTNCVFDMYEGGLINLEVIAAGIPLFASQAHQYAVDPQYVNVIGQNPDINLHTSFVNVEPYSGITMHAGKVAQIQIRVGPTTCFNTSLPPTDICAPDCLTMPCLDGSPCTLPPTVRPDFCFGTCPVDGPEICPYEHVRPDTYLPVFWYVEGGSINDAKADEFKAGVVFGRGFITFSEIFFNILGPLMILPGLFYCWKYHGDVYLKREEYGTLGDDAHQRLIN